MPLTQVQGGMLAGSTNTTTTIQSNGTTAITINSSQNVGVGTTSPTARLHVYGGSNNQFKVESSGAEANFTLAGTSYGQINNSVGDWYLTNDASANIIFRTASTERMRINSAGQALFGATSLLGSRNSQVGININGKDDALFIQNYGSGIGWGVTMRPSSSSSGGNGDCFNFTNTSFTTVGTIATSSSATAYNTSSDYRLKENIAPMIGALNTVSQLKPCTYTWKADGKDGQGFIAHELQAVIPDAVTGEKDAIDKDGNIKPQGVDASFLVATLTAAIQELNAKVEAQAAEIAALKK